MKNSRNSNVTVVIPTLNEARNIGSVILELHQMGYDDILVIDGNSRDRTVEIAKELGAKVIFQKGNGKGDALRQVFNHDGLDGDLVVMMDADGSMDPKEIYVFIEALERGADLAKGSRFMAGGYSDDMNLVRRIGNQFFLLLVNLLWGAKYTDLCYGFGAFRKSALKRLNHLLKSDSFEIETELFIKVLKLGLRVVEVPSVEFKRRHGKSNLRTVPDGFRILKTIAREFLDRSKT